MQDSFIKSLLKNDPFSDSCQSSVFSSNSFFANDNFTNFFLNSTSVNTSESCKTKEFVGKKNKNDYSFLESRIKASSTPLTNNKKRVFANSEINNFNDSFSPIVNKKIRLNADNSEKILNDASVDLFL